MFFRRNSCFRNWSANNILSFKQLRSATDKKRQQTSIVTLVAVDDLSYHTHDADDDDGVIRETCSDATANTDIDPRRGVTAITGTEVVSMRVI